MDGKKWARQFHWQYIFLYLLYLKGIYWIYITLQLLIIFVFYKK